MLIFMDTSVGYIRPIRSSEVWKMLWIYIPEYLWRSLCAFLEVSAKSSSKETEYVFTLDDSSGFGGWFGCLGVVLIVKTWLFRLDTHVCRVAYYFKLTDTETFSLKNARRITAALAEVFPDDPCLGDFAFIWIRSQRGDLSCRNSIEVSIKPLLSPTYKTGSVSADSFYFCSRFVY